MSMGTDRLSHLRGERRSVLLLTFEIITGICLLVTIATAIYTGSGSGLIALLGIAFFALVNARNRERIQRHRLSHD